jgi:hypothetical protein
MICIPYNILNLIYLSYFLKINQIFLILGFILIQHIFQDCIQLLRFICSLRYYFGYLFEIQLQNNLKMDVIIHQFIHMPVILYRLIILKEFPKRNLKYNKLLFKTI